MWILKDEIQLTLTELYFYTSTKIQKDLQLSTSVGKGVGLVDILKSRSIAIIAINGCNKIENEFKACASLLLHTRATRTVVLTLSGTVLSVYKRNANLIFQRNPPATIRAAIGCALHVAKRAASLGMKWLNLATQKNKMNSYIHYDFKFTSFNFNLIYLN